MFTGSPTKTPDSKTPDYQWGYQDGLKDGRKENSEVKTWTDEKSNEYGNNAWKNHQKYNQQIHKHSLLKRILGFALLILAVPTLPLWALIVIPVGGIVVGGIGGCKLIKGLQYGIKKTLIRNKIIVIKKKIIRDESIRDESIKIIDINKTLLATTIVATIITLAIVIFTSLTTIPSLFCMGAIISVLYVIGYPADLAFGNQKTH